MKSADEAPVFSRSFKRQFENLLRWRRDVRDFTDRPVDPDLVLWCLDLATLAPSVGYAQPWRFIINESAQCRSQIIANYEEANRKALEGYSGDQKQRYAKLKLSGLREAPVHIAVLCDEDGDRGQGLGRKTMPEMVRYSVVCAVHTFWLAARLRGLGVGWVSILDPAAALSSLGACSNHSLIAYLCVGWPCTQSATPKLETEGWEEKAKLSQLMTTLR